MYTQEFLLNLNYVCVCPGMLMYLFIRCVCPGISLLLYNSFQSSMFLSLLMKKSNGGYRVAQENTDWAKKLQSILFAYRIHKQASTRFSPFYMMYGRESPPLANGE